jgi:hypothetical protein
MNGQQRRLAPAVDFQHRSLPRSAASALKHQDFREKPGKGMIGPSQSPGSRVDLCVLTVRGTDGSRCLFLWHTPRPSC